MRQNLRPVLVIVSLTIVGIWLLVWSWNHLRNHQLLDQGAAVTEDRVIESSTRKLSKGGQSWTLVVEYSPEKHDAATRAFDVGGDACRAALDSCKASVAYLPDRPEISRVTRFAILPFRVVMGLGGLMLLAGTRCPCMIRPAQVFGRHLLWRVDIACVIP